VFALATLVMFGHEGSDLAPLPGSMSCAMAPSRGLNQDQRTPSVTMGESMIPYIPLILFGVTLNAVAQLLLKKGMMSIGQFSFSRAELFAIVPSIAFSPFILAGVASYGIGVVIWMLVLSRVDVSAAYPFLSLGYIVAAICAWVFFAEHISLMRIFGIALTCIGVIFISQS
jgi:drug/metabolite transporter (DMT)-like permease